MPKASPRLDRPVDETRDHILGSPGAGITLVEYGSYACPHCRAAHERVARVREQLGDRLRYVFRHRPVTGSDIAWRAAELAERAAGDPERFWAIHDALMTRSKSLTEDDLDAVSRDLGLAAQAGETANEAARQAKTRVQADAASAAASGVQITPTFFINGRRYDGPWDDSSLFDALQGRLGHRLRTAAVDFAGWSPSAGILLLAATVLAVALTNSAAGPGFVAFWRHELGFTVAGGRFGLPLLNWINDGLLTVFFLVVGLEIKREFTVGHLAMPRSAALPVAAAIGGMVAPALIYMRLAPAPWSGGWGVPMATDTAFAIALMAMMGRRVPAPLRIFLTAAAIVDDIGAIAVVTVFYSGTLHLAYLAAGAGVIAGLVVLNRARVYSATPYLLLGVALWACMHEGGLHSTLAGVILALFVPTRPPPNLKALMVQADTIITAETLNSGQPAQAPSPTALRALDAIYKRLESPADRLLRNAGLRSSYVVLPLFAFANAGVVLSTGVLHSHGPLMLAIIAGLAVGKPLGVVLACILAVRLGVAVKPADYSWTQLAGAGALAGIGFTMSLFIAGQAFADPADFAAAKIAVFAASVLSAIVGAAVLWIAGRPALST
jgi:NhaA family Na+:H+ antiporter